MVRRTLLCVLLLAPTIACAVTADELRALTDQGEAARRLRDSHVKPGQPEKLLSGMEEGATSAAPVSPTMLPSNPKAARTPPRGTTGKTTKPTKHSPTRATKYDTPVSGPSARPPGSEPAPGEAAVLRIPPATPAALPAPPAAYSDTHPPIDRAIPESSTPALAAPRDPVPERTTATMVRVGPLPPAGRDTPAPSPRGAKTSLAAALAVTVHDHALKTQRTVTRVAPTVPSAATPVGKSATAMVTTAPEPLVPAVVLNAPFAAEPVHRVNILPVNHPSAAPSAANAPILASPAPPPELYLPPVRRAAPEHVARSDAVPVNDKRHFGITLGTWFKARLNRNVSNAESGLVELTVEDDVSGSHRTLSRGAILFAEKSLNEATRRLELRVVKGITPSRFEFQLSARGFDLNRASGVPAIVASDTQAIASRGANRGLIAGARTMVREMLGAHPVASEAVRGASDSVLSDSAQAAERASLPTVTGFACAQELWMRVEETF